MSKTRYSRQRDLIYQALIRSKEHPTAETIYQTLKNDHPSLSLGTVYRNLNLLAEEGKIVRMPFQVDRYDGNAVEHPHFLCNRCGKLYDIEIPHMWELDQAVTALGYEVERHELIFKGTCLECIPKDNVEEP